MCSKPFIGNQLRESGGYKPKLILILIEVAQNTQ